MDPGSPSSSFIFSDMEFALALLRQTDTEICPYKLAELLGTSDVDAAKKQLSQFNEKYLMNQSKKPHSNTSVSSSEDMDTHLELMKKIERLLEMPITKSPEQINSRKELVEPLISRFQRFIASCEYAITVLQEVITEDDSISANETEDSKAVESVAKAIKTKLREAGL
jgi:hypothetical protein